MARSVRARLRQAMRFFIETGGSSYPRIGPPYLLMTPIVMARVFSAHAQVSVISPTMVQRS